MCNHIAGFYIEYTLKHHLTQLPDLSPVRYYFFSFLDEALTDGLNCPSQRPCKRWYRAYNSGPVLWCTFYMSLHTFTLKILHVEDPTLILVNGHLMLKNIFLSILMNIF